MTMSDSPVHRRHVLVLASGSFGNAVGARLAEYPPAQVVVQEFAEGTHPSVWPYAELIVLATSHERPRIAEALDRAAFDWGIPWFAVHPGATDVQCGPVVIPGRTACHKCYRARRNQHRRAAVPASDGDRAQPTGFPQHHVGIATGFAQQAIDEVFVSTDLNRLGGTVRRFDQVTGTVSRSSVVAVDRCPRCRKATAPQSGELFEWLAAISTGGASTKEAKAQ